MCLVCVISKKHRKFLIAAAAGLLCFLLSGVGIEVRFENIQINVVWSVVFPLLVGLAYGPRYAVIAGLAGGAWFPFILWANNGYANILNFFILISLYAGAGFLIPRQRNDYSFNRFAVRLFLFMAVFGVIAFFNYFVLFNFLLSFNPAPWTDEAVNQIDRFVLTGILVKDLVNYSFLILLGELLLRLPAIRALLSLDPKPEFVLNNRLFIGSIMAGTLIWGSFVLLDTVLFYTPVSQGQHYYLLALNVIIWSSVLVCRALVVIVEKRLLSESYFKQKEQEFRNIFESIHVGIGITDLQGRYQFFNKWWQHKLGYSDEEMKTITNADVTYPDDLERTRKNFQALVNREIDGYSLEKRYVRKDGSVFWGQLHESAVAANGGPLKLVSGVINDITEKKQAEEVMRNAQVRQEAMLTNITDVIAILDSKGVNLYKSPNVERLFGWKPEELVGRNYIEKIIPEDREKVLEVFTTVLEYPAETGLLECRYQRKRGDYRWIEISAVNCLDSPEIAGILVNYKDISERKKTFELEQEVAVARKSVEFKQKFLANMSHEIRTPLTGVLGMADILAQTRLDSQQKDYLTTLMQSGENLKEIINLILDYSKIEAGKLKINSSDFRVDELFTESRKYFAAICNKALTWEESVDVKVPRAIRSDKIRLNQILRNFISNAVKFTDAGSVKLSLFPVYPDDFPVDGDTKETITLRFEVKDTGKGVSHQLQEKLFEPFYQAENALSRSIDGTGLGLAICKELAAMLDGKVGLESTPGAGSTFWFTFSCQKVSEKELAISSGLNHDAAKMVTPLRILLVEDKIVNRKVISIMLTSLGHQVEFAVNGQKALEIYTPGAFDLILMDIQMPVLDGVSATQMLRQMHSVLPPIVGISANAFEGDREKYMNMGLDEYLTKPVKTEDFRNLVETLKIGQ